MIELNPDRHDELAALIAQHLEQGGETLEAARWNARAAHWAGYSHPHDALRLWAKVTELASELPEDEETSALGVFSRLLQLDYAWRLGMEQERVDSLVEEAREIATRTGDLRSLTLLRLLESARPGLDAARRAIGPRPSTRRSRLRTSPATTPCGWRSGPRAPTRTWRAAISTTASGCSTRRSRSPGTTTARGPES